MIGTTTPEVKPGGIPSFVQRLKGSPGYEGAVFLEWAEAQDANQLSLGSFRRSLVWRTLVSQYRVLAAGRGFAEIEVHSIRTGLIALIVHRRKCVFFYHGPGFQEAAVEGAGLAKRLWLYLVETLLLQGLPRYLTASEAFRRRLRENHGVPLERIRVLRPKVVVDRERYVRSLEVKLHEARSTGRVDCIICRRLVRRVGVVEFLRLFSGAGAPPGLRITVLGGGPLESEVDALCARDARLTFRGEVSDEDRNEAYNRALFNLVPTLHLEGLGMVVYEGLTHGAIPMVTRVGGMPELIDELRAGRHHATQLDLLAALTLRTAEKEVERQRARLQGDAR